MKVILLAAGESSRVNPISNKNFLIFSGKPLLIHAIQKILALGWQDIVIVANKNYKSQTQDLLDIHKISAKIVVQNEASSGSMLGGVIAGLENIQHDVPICVINSNDIIDLNIVKKMEQKLKSADGVILAKKIERYFPGGYLTLQEERIVKIIEKPTPGTEPSNFVNIVVHMFRSSKKIREIFSKATDYEAGINELAKKYKLLAQVYTDYWEAIKYPWHVLTMTQLLLTQQKSFIHSSAEICDQVELRGKNIFIDEGVKIFTGSTIVGPCYIGKNTIIGNGCLIRESNIGEKNKIGFQTEIARSFLGSEVSTHNAYIGDSVVDNGVNFGAFSATANWRFDKKPVKVKVKNDLINSHHEKLGAFIGKNVKIGIHASLLPGAKIPANTYIMPQEIFPKNTTS